VQTLRQQLPTAEMGTAQRSTDVYFVILNGKHHSTYFCKEDALVEAGQLDYILNSPELNDGVQGVAEIQTLSFAEMMESQVEMVI